MRERKDIGESLIEIVLTILIMGLTITALVSSLATAGNAGNAQRSSVATDVVMRNYAEATKAGARSCAVAGATYVVDYTAPAGFTATSTPASHLCPAVTAAGSVRLQVTGPMGFHDVMDIKVRTP